LPTAVSPQPALNRAFSLDREHKRLNVLTLALRYELWDKNIRVSSATPGVVATAIWKASGVPPPPRAQSAEQSAQTILAGVAKNERLVLGGPG
jgi:short-subunit dehydrogenase